MDLPTLGRQSRMRSAEEVLPSPAHASSLPPPSWYRAAPALAEMVTLFTEPAFPLAALDRDGVLTVLPAASHVDGLLEPVDVDLGEYQGSEATGRSST